MKWAGAVRIRVFQWNVLTIDLYVPDLDPSGHTPIDGVIKKFSRSWTERMAK